MAFFADLHVHSKHSRATSRDCDLENLAWWAGSKGIGVVGTGDFTHPAWFAEIRDKLVPEGDTGLFRLRDDLERERLARLPASCRGPVRFMLSVEISTIYKKDDRTRKIHHLVYAPDLATVERFNAKLGALGNLSSDGRPILGLDSRPLLEIVLESGPGAYLVPAHIWTPWFAVLGAMSGFDHVDHCYGDLAEHVFAVETGLSSDPPMNWRVSGLDRYRLVSNSDAHSPPMLGREASVFACEPDYFAMRHALETGLGYGGTMEFFPEEGKYHLDGHRKCGIRLDPTETRARAGACPVCRKPVTVGVMNRVETLADRGDGARPETAAPFRSLVPLPEIVGEIARVGPRSKTVAREVSGLVDRLGPELEILSSVADEDLRRGGSELVGEAIARLRRGEVHREAGYDGEYGVIRMFAPREIEQRTVVAPLFASEEPPAPPASPPPRPAVVLAPISGDADAPASATESAITPTAADRDPLEELDSEQRAAAEVVEGPLLVLAGPGSGKTRTCTHRIGHLVSTGRASAEECLALSFTRRAAREMKERLANLLPPGRDVEVTTFHGLGLRILTEQRTSVGLQRGFRVADEDERLAIVRDEFGLSVRRARRLLGQISLTKRTRSTETAGGPGVPATEATLLLDHYQEALSDRRLIDFDDLLDLSVRLLESNRLVCDAYRQRFRWISVDEYQDIDALQYRMVRALAPDAANLCVIGDPDQSIYGFRGADVRFFLRFREDYPTARVVELGRNYRSTPTIVDAAAQVIAPATLATGRTFTAASPTEADVAPRLVVHAARSERAEAEFVAHTIERLLGGYSYFSIDSGRVESGDAAAAISFSDCAVLYRTEAQADAIDAALRRAGLPFQRRTHDHLLDRPAVRAIADRLRHHGNPRDAADAPALPFAGTVAERIDLAAREAAVADELRLGAPTRRAEDGEARPSAAEFRAAADLLLPLAAPFGANADAFLSELALGDEMDTWDARADRVSLLTLHAAKGLEFPVVFLVGCEDGLLPLRFGEAPPDDEAGERRLFFVGLTRARTRLFLSWARRRRVHGRVRSGRPSPYLDDIDGDLLERHRTTSPQRPKPEVRTSSQLALL